MPGVPGREKENGETVSRRELDSVAVQITFQRLLLERGPFYRLLIPYPFKYFLHGFQ